MKGARPVTARSTRGDTNSPDRPRPGYLTLTECRLGRSRFSDLLAVTARAQLVPQRALTVRTLQHLPYAASGGGHVSITAIQTIAFSQAQQLRTDLRETARVHPGSVIPPSRLAFTRMSGSEAELVFGRLHYLRQHRPGAISYTLRTPAGHPVVMASICLLNWPKLERRLGELFPGSVVWDVARVFAFDSAPKDSISHMLSKIRAEVRSGRLRAPGPDGELVTSRPQDVLSTTVDANLGFTGSSYRASNWQQAFTVLPRPYMYLNGAYVSPRQLHERFGTANLQTVRRMTTEELRLSAAPLAQSLVFCARAEGATEPLEPTRIRRG